MFKITGVDKENIKRGDISLLSNLLSDVDQKLIQKLKKDKDNTSFYQGASWVVDELIKILKVPE
jgi:hypothetical protein